MKNSILMGGLVIAIALVPSFASATNTNYAVDAGMSKVYVVPGVSTLVPTLSQDHGSASIPNPPVFALGQWTLEVLCAAGANCDGRIVS